MPNSHQKHVTRFATVERGEVPQGRSGKHKKIVSAILADLDHLKDGSVLKVPLNELGDTKENVRAALNRGARKVNRIVATAADANFLYVWNGNKPTAGASKLAA